MIYIIFECRINEINIKSRQYIDEVYWPSSKIDYKRPPYHRDQLSWVEIVYIH